MSTQDLLYDFDNAFDGGKTKRSCPTFLRHHGVKGQLRLLKLPDEGIDTVKIVLKGTLTNMIRHRCNVLFDEPNQIIRETILRLEDVQQSTSSRYTSDDGNGETFPFHFSLPTYVSDTKSMYPLISSLFASGPFCAFDRPEIQCWAETAVDYSLEATLYRAGEIMATSEQEVRIIDSSDAQPPPLHLGHFPYDYKCSTEKTLRRLHLYGTHKLSIIVAEPRPIEIRPQEGPGYGVFPVRFIVPVAAKDPDTPPKPLTVRTKAQLLSFSFISTAVMKQLPTIGEAKLSPQLAVLHKRGHPYYRKMHVEWGACGTEAGGQEPRKAAWEYETMMWLPICDKTLPPPTFFTPYVARRYSVALRFDVRGDGKATFRLTVPVQIIYPMHSGSGTPSYETVVGRDIEDDAAYVDARDLPAYVK